MDRNFRDDPYHLGEQAMQQRVGVRERMAETGALFVRDHMPEQHRELFSRLPFVLLGSVDHEGSPHASLLAGPPGFLRAVDATTLMVVARPHAADPLARALRVGAELGLLGIEPRTRRRNRMNGVVSAVHEQGFTIEVRQSFGNCPKYIQARQAAWDPDAAGGAVTVSRAERLQPDDLELLRDADTYFIASSVPPSLLGRSARHGVDVSHRGGKPGFVRVEHDVEGMDTLVVPDFSGNNVFNTLGNLGLHPRAGLLFVDFERRSLVQLSVDTQVVWDGTELASFGGAQRLMRYRVRGVLRLRGLPALRWGVPQRSPFLQATGTWPLAASEATLPR